MFQGGNDLLNNHGMFQGGNDVLHSGKSRKHHLAKSKQSNSPAGGSTKPLRSPQIQLAPLKGPVPPTPPQIGMHLYTRVI